MQQQGEEPCESQETVSPESQDETPNVVPDATPPDVKGESDCKDSVLETPVSTTAEEIGKENGNDSISSDTQSTRSKTSRSIKKRHNKQEKCDADSAENEMKSETSHDNKLSETDIDADSSTLTNNVTHDVEDDAQDIIVDESEETVTLETSGESSLADYTVEFPVEDDNKEDSQDVLIDEEEISITTSVSYEVDESKDKHSEVSEKYSLTVSSSELHQFTPIFDSQENVQEQTLVYENLSVSGSSWGGNIRSISARKPMRNSPHFVTHGRSSVSAERVGTDGNYSDTDCSVDTTEGSIFSSLKRKAYDVDSTNSKKQKVNDSKNSKFFSMVSSPLRMLKNKLSDRIVESLNASCPDNATNGNNDEEDEVTSDKIKKEDNEIKEKSLCIVSSEVSNQNSVYRNWCNLM